MGRPSTFSYQRILVWNLRRWIVSALGCKRVFFKAEIQSAQGFANCPGTHAVVLCPLPLEAIGVLPYVSPQCFHVYLCRRLVPRCLRYYPFLPGEQCSHANAKSLIGLRKSEVILFLNSKDTPAKIERVHA